MLTSRRADPQTISTHSSALSGRREVGDKDVHPSAASTFVISHAYFPSGPIFIPPYFVPPRSHIAQQQNDDVSERLQDALQRDAAVATTAIPETVRTASSSNPQVDPSLQGLRPLASKQPAALPPDPSTRSPRTGPRASPSPSPEPNNPSLNQEREATWSDSSRQAFHTMITAPGYVNRYRLSTAKQNRLISYLQQPGSEPLNEDGSKDHQTKYQAAHWVLRDGKLYRKAEGKEKARGGRLRRHLDVEEVWDVLTAEHIRSGHLGRDRLRKVVERRFIGYTLQEIMFVLRECRRCNGREKNQLPATTDHEMSTQNAELPAQEVPAADEESSVGEPATALTNVPFTRKQTSNWMLF